jgi:hypothetical protein
MVLQGRRVSGAGGGIAERRRAAVRGEAAARWYRERRAVVPGPEGLGVLLQALTLAVDEF